MFVGVLDSGSLLAFLYGLNLPLMWPGVRGASTGGASTGLDWRSQLEVVLWWGILLASCL